MRDYLNNIPNMLKPYLKRFHDFCLRSGNNIFHNYKQLPQYQKWLIIVLIIWIFTLPVILCIELEDDFTKYPETLYLLSALAQSLAAIFALVFTISLVAAQLFSRYSHRMLASIFDRITIGYICIFILTIVLCLLTINKATNHGLVKISLACGYLSLLLLIPYFLRFKELLNPEYTIKNLREAAEKKIIENPERIPDEITKIDNFVMSALVLKDYDTFNFGISSVESLSKAIANVINKQSAVNTDAPPYPFAIIISQIRDIAISGIQDPRAPKVAIDSLKNIGVTCSNHKLDFYSGYVSQTLGEIGVKAIQNGQIELINGIQSSVFHALLNIYKTLSRIKLEQTIIMAGQSLGDIGVEAAQHKNNQIPHHAASQIRNLMEDIMGNYFKTSTSSSDDSICASLAHQMGRIGDATVQNSLEEPAGWVATFLSSTGEEAVIKKYNHTPNEAANYLGRMGIVACDKRLEPALESITLCIYDIGKTAIKTKVSKPPRTVVEGLHNIVIGANKFSLTFALERSVRLLIELGILSILHNDNTLRDFIVEKLKEIKFTRNIHYVDLNFTWLESSHTGEVDYLKALTDLKGLCSK